MMVTAYPFAQAVIDCLAIWIWHFILMIYIYIFMYIYVCIFTNTHTSMYMVGNTWGPTTKRQDRRSARFWKGHLEGVKCLFPSVSEGFACCICFDTAIIGRTLYMLGNLLVHTGIQQLMMFYALLPGCACAYAQI